MITSVLDYDRASNSQLQIDCISFLGRLFINDNINHFVIKSYFFQGVRGRYYKLDNYCICFDFTYFDYSIEFNLSYDQLEYYITTKENLIKKCNIEDFWDDNIMIEKFINYLRRDLVKLEIPFNDVSS